MKKKFSSERKNLGVVVVVVVAAVVFSESRLLRTIHFVVKGGHGDIFPR